MGISDIYVAGGGALLKHTISLCSFYFHILMVSDSLMTHLYVCVLREGEHIIDILFQIFLIITIMPVLNISYCTLACLQTEYIKLVSLVLERKCPIKTN